MSKYTSKLRKAKKVIKGLKEELEVLKGMLDIERQKKQQLQKEIGYGVEP